VWQIERTVRVRMRFKREMERLQYSGETRDEKGGRFDVSGIHLLMYGETASLGEAVFAQQGEKPEKEKPSGEAVDTAQKIKEIQTLTGYTHYVKSVAFSPDGKALASGSFGAV